MRNSDQRAMPTRTTSLGWLGRIQATRQRGRAASVRTMSHPVSNKLIVRSSYFRPRPLQTQAGPSTGPQQRRRTLTLIPSKPIPHLACEGTYPALTWRSHADQVARSAHSQDRDPHPACDRNLKHTRRCRSLQGQTSGMSRPVTWQSVGHAPPRDPGRPSNSAWLPGFRVVDGHHWPPREIGLARADSFSDPILDLGEPLPGKIR